MTKPRPWDPGYKATGKNPRTGKPPGKAGRPRFEDLPDNADRPASKLAISRHLDLAPMGLKKLRADGIIKEGQTLEDARFAYIRHLRNLVVQKKMIAEEGGEVLDYRVEKALHTKAQRMRIEIELAEESGEVVRVAALQPLLDEAAGNARVRLLGVPDLVSKEIAAMADRPDEVRAFVKTTITEILDELALGVGRSLGRARRQPDDADAEAPAGSNGAGLGRQVPASVKRGQRRAGAMAD